MTLLFLSGAFADPAVIAASLGRAATGVPAQLAGDGQAGLLFSDLAPDDLARFAFLAEACGMQGRQVRVHAKAELPALAYFPDVEQGDTLISADLLAATARDVMALYGRVTAATVRARFGMMLVRGASTLRAQAGGPVVRRHAARAGDVVVAQRETPYARFFAVEEYDLRFRRFDGSLSDQVNRAVFISGDAVTVLPYDPVRDVVLLIEQFRPGPFARGDAQPWSLEAIAGRIDAGETPEEAARREAVEEAGLTLGAMEYVGGYYPTPGAKAEFLYSYLALTDLPDGIEGVFGVAGEAENIRGHRMPFAAFEALMASGEVNNAPLLLTGLWLQRERTRLQAR